MARRSQLSARFWAPAICASLAVPLVLGTTSAALAAWSANGSGSGGAMSESMGTGATPSGTAGIGSVTVSWAAYTLPNGGPAATGYIISRYNATTGAIQTVNASCTGTVTTTSCTEQSVPAGTWVYTEIPLYNNWSGSQSADSAPIVVHPT
jgi:hypothetical protein